jgi:hypothetical protein
LPPDEVCITAYPGHATDGHDLSGLGSVTLAGFSPAVTELVRVAPGRDQDARHGSPWWRAYFVSWARYVEVSASSRPPCCRRNRCSLAAARRSHVCRQADGSTATSPRRSRRRGRFCACPPADSSPDACLGRLSVSFRVGQALGVTWSLLSRSDSQAGSTPGRKLIASINYTLDPR